MRKSIPGVSGVSQEKEGGPDLSLAPLLTRRPSTPDRPVSHHLGLLTTLVFLLTLPHSTGLLPLFGRSEGLFSHVEVHAQELQVKLLPVGSLLERADGFP